MKKFSFTCPKLALALIVRLVICLIFSTIWVFVGTDILILPFIVGCLVMIIIASISLYDFSFRVFRSLIVVKFDKECIKNAFCKIKYNEIIDVGYENLEFQMFRRITTEFSIVLVINGKDETFKSYNIRKSICIPLNEKTKKAFIEYAPLVAKKFNISL